MNNCSIVGGYSLCSLDPPSLPIELGMDYQTQKNNCSGGDGLKKPSNIGAVAEEFLRITKGVPYWPDVFARLIHVDALSHHRDDKKKKNTNLNIKKSDNYNVRDPGPNIASTSTIHEEDGGKYKDDFDRRMNIAKHLLPNIPKDYNIAAMAASPIANNSHLKQDDAQILAQKLLHNHLDSTATANIINDRKKKRRYRWRRKHSNTKSYSSPDSGTKSVNIEPAGVLHPLTAKGSDGSGSQHNKLFHITSRRRNHHNKSSDNDQLTTTSIEEKSKRTLYEGGVSDVAEEDATDLLKSLISMQSFVEDDLNKMDHCQKSSSLHNSPQYLDKDLFLMSGEEDDSVSSLGGQCHLKEINYSEYMEEYENLANEATSNKAHGHSLPSGIHYRAIEEYHTSLSGIEVSRAWAMM